MKRYAAFLRGINVGGHRVKMDQIRSILATAGLPAASTFIASGNVIIDTESVDPADLESTIEGALEGALGYQVATFVRTLEEVEAVAAEDPGDLASEGSHSVGFFKTAPDAEVAERLMNLNTSSDRLWLEGRELHWVCSGRVSDSPVFDGFPKVTRHVPVTMRNVKTLRRLLSKFSG